MSAQIVFGYWEGFTKDAEGPRSLEETPDGVDVISLAFGVLDQQDPNTIDTSFLTSQWTEAEIRAGIAAIRARGTGQKILISVNGNPNLTDGGWPALDPTTFAENTKAFLASWDLDGIDLDNETSYDPGPAFADVIQALRSTLGPAAIISMPVYLGTTRDAFLGTVSAEMSYVFTMAYWEGYQGQISLLQSYQELLGDDCKAGIGVGIPGMANPGQSTPFDILGKLSAYSPKAGIMIYALNSKDLLTWYDVIKAKLPASC